MIFVVLHVKCQKCCLKLFTSVKRCYVLHLCIDKQKQVVTLTAVKPVQMCQCVHTWYNTPVTVMVCYCHILWCDSWSLTAILAAILT